jgi:hypothetical protein
MYSGLSRRKEPHEERKYQAVQAIEQDYGPVSVTTPGTPSSSRGFVDTQTQRPLNGISRRSPTLHAISNLVWCKIVFVRKFPRSTVSGPAVQPMI